MPARLMTKWPGIVGLVVATMLSAGCIGALWAEEPDSTQTQTLNVFRRQALANGHGLQLSVVGSAIQPSDIEKLAAMQRRSLVRILVYTPDQKIGEDKPAALWEHTQYGLTQIY